MSMAVLDAEADAAPDVRRGVADLLRPWVGYPHLAMALSRSRGTDVFLAGGAVRDLMLGRVRRRARLHFVIGGDNVDYFLHTLGQSGAMAKNPLGLPRWTPERGAVTAEFWPTRTFETEGRCGIADVLRQFDFTANAVAFDFRRRQLVDPLGGFEDACARRMRLVRRDHPDTPIVPGSRLTRRGVVWTRLLHYAATLDFEIEPRTWDWLRDNARAHRQSEAFAAALFQPDLRLASRL